MQNYLIKDVLVVNEGTETVQDVFIRGERIAKMGSNIQVLESHIEVNGSGKMLMPGCIDDQVHFREPGLTHKATIGSEAAAGVAGGVTSFMEMPNTQPPATTQALLEEKYQRAAQTSVANFSFYMGTTNDNADEVLRTDSETVCGIKIFMGSSTGNMLVDDESTLSKVFCNSPMLIATHCEEEAIVKANMALAIEKYGHDIPAAMHPIIRNVDACLTSSTKAKAIAEKCGTRLHILHITTAEELALFSNTPLSASKLITSEVCVHHLWYTADDYERFGNQIKCNPAVKASRHREAIRQALKNGVIDVVATDHAPHTWAEKANAYSTSPSGLPLIQHSLQLMLQIAHEEGWSYAFVAEKMAHNPAILFRITERGYIREGYFADLVLVERKPYSVQQQDLLYLCGWSPLVGQQFHHTIASTWVNGHLAWDGFQTNNFKLGKRLRFQKA